MRQTVTLSSNIATNKILSNKKIYLITKEVRVRPGVRLTIQDGAQIYLLNGPVTSSKIKRAALIFEQGSELRAKKFTIRAANHEGRVERQSDNGGIWFCGNHQSASKDSIAIKHNPKKRISKFIATELKAYYLGRLDPIAKNHKKKNNIKNKTNDDIDGISVLGVGRKEWRINSIKSYYSGDDGLDLTNSDIQVDKIYIKEPTEDGLNISSSRLQIRKNLTIHMENHGSDRDLFDFETDDGGSYVEISKGCQINIEGIFGDQLTLSSQDMGRVKKAKNAIYKFSGRSKKADSLIYSITED